MEHSFESLIEGKMNARLEALEKDLKQIKERIEARFVDIEAHFFCLDHEVSKLTQEIHQQLEKSSTSCNCSGLQIQLDELKRAQSDFPPFRLREQEWVVWPFVSLPLNRFCVTETVQNGFWLSCLCFDSQKTFHIHSHSKANWMIVAQGSGKQLQCGTSKSPFRLRFVSSVNWETDHCDFVEIIDPKTDDRFDVRMGIETAQVGTVIWLSGRNFTGAQRWKIQPSNIPGFVRIVSACRPELCIATDISTGLLLIREVQENSPSFCSSWKIVWD
jgi:hypothetical protein